MHVKIVPASREDILVVAERMRRSDIEELKASSGRTPEQALRRALVLSRYTWTALVDGQPEVMFGCGGNGDGVGCAWLLGSHWMEHPHAARHIWRYSKVYLQKMHEHYHTLFNYVDDRNIVSRRWLERLGFQAVKHEPHYGVERRPFTLYVSRLNV